MKTSTQWAMIFGLVVGLLISVPVVKYTQYVDQGHTRKNAVANACGHYDYKTGDFTWNLMDPDAISESKLEPSGILLPALGEKDANSAAPSPKKTVHSSVQPRGGRPGERSEEGN